MPGSAARHARTAASGAHAARQCTADFYYTRKQNVRWLGYMYSKGAVDWAERQNLQLELARDEEEVVGLGLSRAASAVLAGVEEERKMARERAGTAGRVADWREEGRKEEVVKGVEEEKAPTSAFESLASGSGDSAAVVEKVEEECEEPNSPIIISPVRE